MSKRLYDERIEMYSQDEITYMDEIMFSRRDLIHPMVRLERLRSYKRIVKIDQLYAHPDIKPLYDIRLRTIDLILEGLEFALKLDILNCPL